MGHSSKAQGLHLTDVYALKREPFFLDGLVVSRPPLGCDDDPVGRLSLPDLHLALRPRGYGQGASFRRFVGNALGGVACHTDCIPRRIARGVNLWSHDTDVPPKAIDFDSGRALHLFVRAFRTRDAIVVQDQLPLLLAKPSVRDVPIRVSDDVLVQAPLCALAPSRGRVHPRFTAWLNQAATPSFLEKQEIAIRMFLVTLVDSEVVMRHAAPRAKLVAAVRNTNDLIVWGIAIDCQSRGIGRFTLLLV